MSMTVRKKFIKQNKDIRSNSDFFKEFYILQLLKLTIYVLNCIEET